MKQLWQSLAITVVLGGVLLGGITYGVHSMGTQAAPREATATTSPETTALPAAAVTAAPKDPFEGLNLTGQAAIVVDLSNGQTLYSQNADARLPLASLTKLITFFEAQRVLSPQSLVTMSSTSLAQDGDYGFVQGETFTYQDLAKLALTNSSNDAAEAIAEAAAQATGQTIPAYMATAINAAGLSHTSATNSTGLDLSLTEAGAYGSARDVAKLAQEFLAAAPVISEATTHSAVTIYSTAGVAHSLSNTNPDVSSLTGLLLSKTGYTDLAGGNLAVIFDAGINHPVAVVVLGSTHDARFTDVEKLMHATLASFKEDKSH